MDDSFSSEPFEPVKDAVVVGRYRLVEELGRGATGAVWRAEDTRLQMPCALKLMLHEHLQDPTLKERFLEEARIAARIRSPYTVQVLDVGEWEQVPFIALELLEGEDLETRLQRVGRLSPEMTCEVVRQVAHGLTTVHRAGLIHRDLKPENIYLLSQEPTVVKLLDYGIAKQHSKEGLQRTALGAVIGTPEYMSPEQANADGDVDYRSDLWSLAVVSYRCLTGRTPFTGESLAELLTAVLSGPIPPLPGPSDRLPAGLRSYWSRATQRDREARFQSALELAGALQQAVLTPAEPTPQGTPVEEARPHSLLWLGIGLLGALIGLFVARTASPDPNPTGTTTASSPGEQSGHSQQVQQADQAAAHSPPDVTASPGTLPQNAGTSGLTREAKPETGSHGGEGSANHAATAPATTRKPTQTAPAPAERTAPGRSAATARRPLAAERAERKARANRPGKQRASERGSRSKDATSSEASDQVENTGTASPAQADSNPTQASPPEPDEISDDRLGF